MGKKNNLSSKLIQIKINNNLLLMICCESIIKILWTQYFSKDIWCNGGHMYHLSHGGVDVFSLSLYIYVILLGINWDLQGLFLSLAWEKWKEEKWCG